MRWLAVRNADMRRSACQMHDPTPLSMGSIVLEQDVEADGRPHRLIDMPRLGQRRLTFDAIPGGGFAFTQLRKNDQSSCKVQWPEAANAETLRMSYAWNEKDAFAELALEVPGRTTILRQPVHDHLPITASDIGRLITARNSRYSSAVSFVAVADGVVPLGPEPGLAGTVPIATPDGPKRLDLLRRGDHIWTASGKSVPVLHRVVNRVPAFGSYRPVRLLAPYLGLSKDIVVSATQRIRMQGSEVEYLFGHEAVLVQAQFLAETPFARFEVTSPVVTYHQVILPHHEIIDACGAPLESMFVGRIRRKPEALERSVLARYKRNTLPEHVGLAYPVLRAFEVANLVARRAA